MTGIPLSVKKGFVLCFTLFISLMTTKADYLNQLRHTMQASKLNLTSSLVQLKSYLPNSN